MTSEGQGIRLLLVDDDEQIRQALVPLLTEAGYTVETAESGEAASEIPPERAPDIVVLDMSLPGMDGIEVCKRIRQFSRVPVLMLTVRDDYRCKIDALDAGADDYLTKPFAVGELLARLRALRRRSEQQLDYPIQIADLMIDVPRRKVTLAGEEIRLTKIEFEILALLALHAGRVVSSHAIIDRLWQQGPPHDTDLAQLLRVHVSNLRRKLEPHPSVPRYIITEPGVGFRLVDK